MEKKRKIQYVEDLNERVWYRILKVLYFGVIGLGMIYLIRNTYDGIELLFKIVFMILVPAYLIRGSFYYIILGKFFIRKKKKRKKYSEETRRAITKILDE